MSIGAAKRLRLRLFIEGIELPVIGASIQCQPNSPVMASLQVPPLSEGTKVLPRSLVHLFFYDLYEYENPVATRRGNLFRTDKVQYGPTPYQVSRKKLAGIKEVDTPSDLDDFVNDQKNQHFKLLFVGEIVGFSWQKTPNGRALVYQCADPSIYWDYAYQFNNTDLFGPGYKALFSGGSTNLFTDFLDEPGGVIAHLIQSPSTQYPNLKGLLGGVVHLLEAMGGSYYYEKKYAGQNIFFSIAELRLRITQMITALETDPTGQRLLNAGGFGDLLGRSLGSIGSQASFRSAINMLMKHIFHETYGIPTPRFVPGTEGTITGFVRKKLAEDPKYGSVLSTARSIRDSIESVVAALVSNSKTGSAKERDDIVQRIKTMQTTCQKMATQTQALGFKPVSGLFRTSGTELGTVAVKVRINWKPGVAEPIVKDLSDRLLLVNEKMKQVEDYDIPVTSKKEARPARLNQQIFRPDVWFSAPPMCNVIFPDQYFDMGYSREFLKEPTRLLLKTHEEFFGEDELFDNFYFAPKAFGIKTGKNDLSSILQNDIMAHELFTGILPVFEKMGELNIFAARSGTVNGKTPKVGLAQRSTNFMYFKHRFAARQLSLQALFLPYLVPGFPAVVLDKYVDIDAIAQQNQVRKATGRTQLSYAGTHFLGNLENVSYQCSQSDGGITSITMTYARQHDESVEFLGAIENDQQLRKRFDQDALGKATVGSLTVPKLGALGPNYGIIVEVREVTSRFKPAEDGTEFFLPLYTGSRRKGPPTTVTVPIDAPKEARLLGPDVVAAVGGDMNKIVRFKAYELVEQVPKYRRVEADLPAEEYIRPGWYGDVWHPSQIGNAYDDFFRCRAITDPQQVSDSDGASTGIPQQDAIDALAEAASGFEVEDDPKKEAPAILALDKGASVQQAVDFIVTTYSYAKQNQMDLDTFITGYIWRPVATMLDMFGTYDLALDAEGKNVVSGVEGFHSRAFGQYEDLFGLVTADIESVLGIRRGSDKSAKMDTRKRKWLAVKTFRDSLDLGASLIG